MNKGGPPAVQVTENEAIVWFDGEPHSRIKWSEVQEIGIDITVVKDLGYSEAFWVINDGAFGSPVDMIVGADEFKAKMFAFNGFDKGSYEKALENEESGVEGYIKCWESS